MRATSSAGICSSSRISPRSERSTNTTGRSCSPLKLAAPRVRRRRTTWNALNCARAARSSRVIVPLPRDPPLDAPGGPDAQAADNTALRTISTIDGAWSRSSLQEARDALQLAQTRPCPPRLLRAPHETHSTALSHAPISVIPNTTPLPARIRWTEPFGERPRPTHWRKPCDSYDHWPPLLSRSA